jgi:hypothetical protein
MTTTAEETTTVSVDLEDDVTCEAEWSDKTGECGKPASWRATVHSIGCQMQSANFCTDCMMQLKLMSLMSACATCLTRDLLRDVRKL